MKKLLTFCFFVATASTVGCSDGQGTIAATTYGEAFIEDGISATDINDGWAIHFDHFTVTIKNLRVAGIMVPDASAQDLVPASMGKGHVLGSIKVGEGSYKNASFTISRVEVQGSATKMGTTKTFSWVFDAPTNYSACEATTNVSDQGMATFQVTVHADHLFVDSLVSTEPQLLFQPLASADTNNDGAITQAELQAAGIGAYDPGNAQVANLWQWLGAAVRTIGHADGEGHCKAN